MKTENCKLICMNMHIPAAVFRIEMTDGNTINAAYVEDCNETYMRIAESRGISKEDILAHRSYFNLTPEYDPRWNYYFYQAAVLKKNIRGELRSKEFGNWLEFSGGPASEENTCWMIFVDQSKYKDESERYYKMSMIDRLTSTKNRNAYEDKLHEYMESGISVGVIMADINSLKQINDHRGHRAGDDVIRRTADFLCSLSKTELPYRIGGDEFIIFLENATREETMSVLDQVKDFSEVSLSCGAAWTDDSSEIEDTVREADAEMYQAKKAYYRIHERRHV